MAFNRLLGTTVRGRRDIAASEINITPEKEQFLIYLLLGTVAITALLLIYKKIIESCQRKQKHSRSSGTMHHSFKAESPRKSPSQPQTPPRTHNPAAITFFPAETKDISPAKQRHLERKVSDGPHLLKAQSPQRLRQIAKQDEKRAEAEAQTLRRKR